MYGLHPRKGTIAVGSDADLVIWEEGREITITNSMLHHNVDYTRYEGMAPQRYGASMTHREATGTRRPAHQHKTERRRLMTQARLAAALSAAACVGLGAATGTDRRRAGAHRGAERQAHRGRGAGCVLERAPGARGARRNGKRRAAAPYRLDDDRDPRGARQEAHGEPARVFFRQACPESGNGLKCHVYTGGSNEEIRQKRSKRSCEGNA